MVYLHWEVSSGRIYINNKTSVKKKLLPFVLSQLKQTKSFFHFQQEIFCLLFLKELSRKGFRKYRHTHSQVMLCHFKHFKFNIIKTVSIVGKFLISFWSKSSKANHEIGWGFFANKSHFRITEI